MSESTPYRPAPAQYSGPPADAPPPAATGAGTSQGSGGVDFGERFGRLLDAAMAVFAEAQRTLPSGEDLNAPSAEQESILIAAELYALTWSFVNISGVLSNEGVELANTAIALAYGALPNGESLIEYFLAGGRLDCVELREFSESDSEVAESLFDSSVLDRYLEIDASAGSDFGERYRDVCLDVAELAATCDGPLDAAEQQLGERVAYAMDSAIGSMRAKRTVTDWMRTFALPTGGPATSGQQHSARWATDPYGRYEIRYFDGSAWTEHVANGSMTSTDPAV